ncbi:S8 family serine peptidase [Streptacidiphilus sp. 4-A2]|nr:S8 family serine peptidase [Streptacidiphilus sp. 4-A2]
MAFVRTQRVMGAVATAGAFLLVGAPAAHADAARDKQWPLQAFGAAQEVWPITTGEGQIVAVIDTGFRTTHVDLAGQFLPGKDFAPGSYNAAANASHGTMMASIIAAHGHGPGGSDGIMGLAPGVKILPLVVDVQAADNDQEIAGAIRYAVGHGAGVINMSFADVDSSPIEQSAVAYAEAHNVVLVAGAGNDGVEVDSYPAAYPGVVDVGVPIRTGASGAVPTTVSIKPWSRLPATSSVTTAALTPSTPSGTVPAMPLPMSLPLPRWCGRSIRSSRRGR